MFLKIYSGQNKTGEMSDVGEYGEYMLPHPWGSIKQYLLFEWTFSELSSTELELLLGRVEPTKLHYSFLSASGFCAFRFDISLNIIIIIILK